MGIFVVPRGFRMDPATPKPPPGWLTNLEATEINTRHSHFPPANPEEFGKSLISTLPVPGIIAADLEAALERFAAIGEDLKP